MILIKILSFLVGAVIVIGTLFSAIQTFVLPRSAQDKLTRTVFLMMRSIFNLRLKRSSSYLKKDRILAFYAPISLLALLASWLFLVMVGFMAMFWGLGVTTWKEAYRLSGSSLLTLGFAQSDSLILTVLMIAQASIGLILVALLIAYLPTMYAAFSRREAAVTLLEVRAGNPPSVLEMLLRFRRIHGLETLTEQWRNWETWFADIEESHTSLAALVFFRSPQPEHSWVTAAGTILDTAAITLSTVDIPNDPQAALCIRAGFLALRRIGDFFNIPYKPDPHFPSDPISISREEYDELCRQLAEADVPLKNDREQAWRDFAGWRVNYDYVLLALAGMIMVPWSPWIGDRPIFISHKMIVHKSKESTSTNQKLKTP